MLSSRNLHFAVLGLILGASIAYVFAFYQAQSQAQAQQPQAALPANHPSVNSSASDPGLEALKTAVDRNPTDADMAARYGNALFKVGRTNDAVAAWEHAVKLRPDDLTVRSLLGAVLWSEGRPEEGRKHLQVALTQDPRHLPTLHALFLIALETDHDEKKAAEILKTIEGVDPNYGGLADLRDRMKRARPTGG